MKGPFLTPNVMKGPFLTLDVMKGPFLTRGRARSARPAKRANPAQTQAEPNIGRSPPHLWLACPPVDLAKPDHTVSRGQPEAPRAVAMAP